MTYPAANPCPCGSGKTFAECCGPILEGEAKAKTAERLMRARYTAYATDDIDFLFQSSGPEVREEFDRESTRRWAEGSEWTGMEVLDVERGGEGDDEGTVEFIAHYTVQGRPFNHQERSLFRRIDGEWRFIDGKLANSTPIRREAPTVGRNDPCPCGSGKKYKKCCGK